MAPRRARAAGLTSAATNLRGLAHGVDPLNVERSGPFPVKGADSCGESGEAWWSFRGGDRGGAFKALEKHDGFLERIALEPS